MSAAELTSIIMGAVGAIGGLAGVAAFVWQVATRRASLHRVLVETSNSLLVLGGSAREWTVAVTAYNVGAGPVTIDGWGISVGRNGNLNQLAPMKFDPPIPHRLEPGASISFHMSMDGVRESSAELGVPFSKMRPWVRLGTNKVVKANRPVRLT